MAAKTLGINGLGRIGKLTLWNHLGDDDIDRFVVNTGRQVGTSLASLAEYLAKDSTYGPLHRYLQGRAGRRAIEVVDEQAGLLRVHGKEVLVLREARNPKDIPWWDHRVSVVVDTTGRFVDPTVPADAPAGSLRGHLLGGAKVVLQSSPFKIKTKNVPLPDDSITLINGINHYAFDPARHVLVSGASCTTTALAHMLRPLLDRDLTRHMITAGMSTVHAATNTQHVLDAVPGAGSKDLRKTRSVLNNIILTSTNAAKALEQVMPEIRDIGFMADSVRIPTSTVSLIILNLTFQTELTLDGRPLIDRAGINAIYKEAAEGESRGLLSYSEEQNVSADMIGEDAAVVIEGVETHTRTGFIDVRVPVETYAAVPAGMGEESAYAGASPAWGDPARPDGDGDANGGSEPLRAPEQANGRGNGGSNTQDVRIPVTHVKVFGWYDNELGSYTVRLGELTRFVTNQL